jgi:hypothetical protein
MRTTRRTLLVLAVLALVLPLAAAAGAKDKPAPPPRPAEPVLYEVAMTLVEGHDGLATNDAATGDELCFYDPEQSGDDPIPIGPITMEFDGHGYMAGVHGPEVPRLAVTADITWSRLHPETPPTQFFGECHGGQVLGSTAEWAGTLMITADSGGNPTGLVWHFDHYATLEYYGKDKVRTLIEEGLTLRSLCDPVDPEYAACQEFQADEREEEPGTYDVSGTFTLYVWDRTIIPNPYVFQGSSFFKFTMTFTPVP